jgi:hypothetical protein
MKSMCCLCIQFTHENTSERTILHQVNKNKFWSGWGQIPPEPPFQVWLLALQKRLATPLAGANLITEESSRPHVVNPLTVSISSGKGRLILDLRHVNKQVRFK